LIRQSVSRDSIDMSSSARSALPSIPTALTAA
jgi:hypothetical protein